MWDVQYVRIYLGTQPVVLREMEKIRPSLLGTSIADYEQSCDRGIAISKIPKIKNYELQLKSCRLSLDVEMPLQTTGKVERVH